MIRNITANPTRRVDLVMGIGYEDDIAKARKIMSDIVAADDRILKDPAPTIAVSELGDSSVNFVVRPWVKTGDYWDVYFSLTEKIKLAFDQEGISIPFPQRDIHIYQEKNRIIPVWSVLNVYRKKFGGGYTKRVLPGSTPEFRFS